MVYAIWFVLCQWKLRDGDSPLLASVPVTLLFTIDLLPQAVVGAVSASELAGHEHVEEALDPLRNLVPRPFHWQGFAS